MNWLRRVGPLRLPPRPKSTARDSWRDSSCAPGGEPQNFHAKDLGEEAEVGFHIRGADHPVGRPALRAQLLRHIGWRKKTKVAYSSMFARQKPCNSPSFKMRTIATLDAKVRPCVGFRKSLFPEAHTRLLISKRCTRLRAHNGTNSQLGHGCGPFELFLSKSPRFPAA